LESRGTTGSALVSTLAPGLTVLRLRRCHALITASAHQRVASAGKITLAMASTA